MIQPNRKEVPSEVRVVVEVDGNPVGFINLDMERLWPLINHRRRDVAPAEWIDRPRFRTAVRASVAKNLTNHLQSQLYKALGKEIVRAELNLETMVLKAEAAAQIFGKTRNEVAALRTGSVETPVERMANSPGSTVPLVVMPLNGSASPLLSASRDICRKRSDCDWPCGWG